MNGKAMTITSGKGGVRKSTTTVIIEAKPEIQIKAEGREQTLFANDPLKCPPIQRL